MNRSEAAQVLAVLAAPYPGEPVTDDAAEVWYQSTLSQLEASEALSVVRDLVRHERFRPTPAVFNEALRVRRVHGAVEQRPALPAPSVAPETATENRVRLIAEMREMLARQKSAVHDHKGPHPCRVCGGMAS